MGGGIKKLRSEPKSRAKLHEQRMARFQEKQQAQPPSYEPVRYWNRGEAEGVLGEQLSIVLRRFVVEWLADRPTNHTPMGQLNSEKTQAEVFMGPIQYLAEKTEINIRRVSAIVNGEIDFVGLSQADKLLLAANLDHKLDTDEIRVISNPKWSLERWVEYMEARGCG